MSKILKVTAKDNKNSKFKITVGKEYDVIEQEGKFIIIKNDNEKVVRYSLDLFKDVKHEPVAPPPPPVRTEQDLIRSIRRNGAAITFRDFNNNVVRLNINELNYNNSKVSRGVGEIDPLMNYFDSITRTVNALDADTDLIDLRNELLYAMLSSKLKRSGKRFIVFSYPVYARYEDFTTYLKTISDCVTPEAKRNPNSGNNIIVGVLDVIGMREIPTN